MKKAQVLPGEPRRIAYAYILPAGAFYSVFVIAPIVATLVLSFFQWNGLRNPKFDGLANYKSIFRDPALRSSLYHPAVLLIFYCLLSVTLGLVLSSALGYIKRGVAFYRVAIFMPFMIPGVVAALIWQLVYEPSEGLLNVTLRNMGLGSLARTWLGSFTLSLPAVGLVGTWALTGFCTILFLTGMQKIPNELYDAARVDGASPIHQFWAVTLPNIRGELAVAVVITAIYALRNFDVIYNLTAGGPGYSTTVPAFEVYYEAFNYGVAGTACALAVILALIIGFIAVVMTKVTEEWGT
jgi:raffinose/stachyose/melibiose transport system permease protein